MEHTYHSQTGLLNLRNDFGSAEIFVTGGANLLSLRHREGYELLRTPATLEEFWENPEVWGCPVLFPPNRISGAAFTFGGRQYVLPQNDPKGPNHIHGMLSRRPWSIDRIDDSSVALIFENTPQQDCFAWFPHRFTAILTYRFQPERVWQEIVMQNESDSPMPFGFGFHTVFRLSFSASVPQRSRQTRVRVTTDATEWEREGLFPTGRKVPAQYDWQKGVYPEGLALFTHTPIFPDETGFRGAVFESQADQIRVRYEVSDQFRHWVLWNYLGDKGIFCPEPQTWVIDAPNLHLPPEESGMRALLPGERWQATNCITIERIRE